VTEQLTFKQLSGECRAIDWYKDVIGAVSCEVDLASDHFFADAGFACDYDRASASGNCLYQVQNRVKCWGIADKSAGGKIIAGAAAHTITVAPSA